MKRIVIHKKNQYLKVNLAYIFQITDIHNLVSQNTLYKHMTAKD